jgi:hypothetical protein
VSGKLSRAAVKIQSAIAEAERSFSAMMAQDETAQRNQEAEGRVRAAAAARGAGGRGGLDEQGLHAVWRQSSS